MGLFLPLLGAAALAGSFGLSEGRAPLSLTPHDPTAPGWVAAEACGECHPTQLSEWQGSRHRVAWSNLIFQAGYRAEPRRFCVHCHAPTAAQADEIEANAAWRALPWDPMAPPHTPPVPEPKAAEGITCAVCHLRDGAALVEHRSSTADAAVHDVVEAPGFGTAALCTSCHQFAVPNPPEVSVQLMQATGREHAAWAAREADPVPCQGCHMPEGSHAFSHGAHDIEALRKALVVTREEASLTVEAVGVGHHLPSGDLFRHLTLELWRGDHWQVQATFGRQFSVETDGPGPPVKREAGTTALQPGVPQTVSVLPDATAWRLVYHYGSPQDEARGWLPEGTLLTVVHEGRL